MPKHIHLLVRIPPEMGVPSFRGYLKGKSALRIFYKHPNMKYKFENRHFGTEALYVGMIGLSVASNTNTP